MKMKARAVWSLLGRKKIRNAVSSKFNKMVKYEKDVERVHLEDPRIEWSTNENYDNVEVCKIAGINIPEGIYSVYRSHCHQLSKFRPLSRIFTARGAHPNINQPHSVTLFLLLRASFFMSLLNFQPKPSCYVRLPSTA